MSETVERVAKFFDPRAWQLTPKTPADEKVIDHWKHVARLKARNAIAAMRVPPEDIAEIMSAHASNGMVDWRDLHEAFIDAALK